nr:rod shape-determining protein MreC [Lysobacter sp. CAU 1642]
MFSDGGAGTLRLLVYLLLAVVLMVTDFRGGYLDRTRQLLGVMAEPLYWIAQSPVALARYVYSAAADRQQLHAERETLREELLVARAQLARLEAVQNQNRRLRGLLGGTRGLQLEARLVSLADVDLDPFRHRALLDEGLRDGIEPGAALIDAGGVFGQVIESGPLRATVMLVSDPAHAVPVQVRRSGVRTIAYGTGESDRLRIPNIPQSADIREGDLLITSGLGGRFPAGLPVGTVTRLEQDQTRLFVVAEARPAALLARGRELLLVRTRPASDALDVGPPRSLAELPDPEPAQPAAAAAAGDATPTSGDRR